MRPGPISPGDIELQLELHAQLQPASMRPGPISPGDFRKLADVSKTVAMLQ